MPKKQKKPVSVPMGQRIGLVLMSCFMLGWFWTGVDVFGPQASLLQGNSLMSADWLQANLFADEDFQKTLDEFKAKNLPSEEERQAAYQETIDIPEPEVIIKNEKGRFLTTNIPKTRKLLESAEDSTLPAMYESYLSSAQVPMCTDTDGGRDFAQKGTVTWSEEGIERNFTDVMLGTHELLEYYCEDGHVMAQSVTCRTGVKSQACIESIDSVGEYLGSAPKTDVYQSFDLVPGWNWVSFAITPFSTDPEVLFASLYDEDSDIVIKDYKGNIYWPKMKINTLEDFQMDKGYQIYMTKRLKIEIPGSRLDYPYYLTLKNGWNFMSFPYSESVNVECLLQPLVQAGVFRIAEDQKGNRFTTINGEWMNEIGRFQPGSSYLVYIQAPEGMTFPIVFDPERTCF